jgi:hypothetical protein
MRYANASLRLRDKRKRQDNDQSNEKAPTLNERRGLLVPVVVRSLYFLFVLPVALPLPVMASSFA